MDIEALEKTNIDKFKLKWRWTNPDYLDMPKEDLDKISVLSPESASAVFGESSRLIQESNIENEGQRISTDNSDVAEYLAYIDLESKILFANIINNRSLTLYSGCFLWFVPDLLHFNHPTSWKANRWKKSLNSQTSGQTAGVPC